MWQEDNFQGARAHPPPRQLHFENGDAPGIMTPPPASAKGHQRARTAVDLPPLFPRTQSSSPTRASTFLPFLRPASTRSISPERVSVPGAGAPEQDLAAPGEASANQKPVGAVERLASWFDGASDPVNISLVPSPSKDKMGAVYEQENMDTIFTANPDSLDAWMRRPPKRPNPSIPSGYTAPRFSFFRKSSQPPVRRGSMEADELGALDIRDGLFPTGYPDEFSPAAFKNLQLNAEGLLRRFQQAHIEQQKVIRTMTSATNVQTDELESAQTRTEHLKLQLVEMAEKAAEQEKTIASLSRKLAAPQNSQEPFDMQPQSIRIVSQQSTSGQQGINTHVGSNNRRKRCSDVSTSGESENGSDVSSVVSIFSEALSAHSSGTSITESPVMQPAILHYAMGEHGTVTPKAAPSSSGCPRCHGLSPSEAWDVVGMVKLESACLKERIAELESAQDDALDFLTGLK